MPTEFCDKDVPAPVHAFIFCATVIGTSIAVQVSIPGNHPCNENRAAAVHGKAVALVILASPESPGPEMVSLRIELCNYNITPPITGV